MAEKNSDLKLHKDNLALLVKTRTEQLVRERDRAETALVHKSEFLAKMSHELRTPLNVIIGLTNLMLATELDEEQTNFSEMILRSSESLFRIVDDILYFSKLEADKLEIQSVPFSIRSLTNNAMKIVEQGSTKKSLSYLVNIAEHLPDRLIGDPGRIEQIILNLCNNAVKFTEQGEITVSVHCPNDINDQSDECVMTLNVTDTGIGIPQDKLEKIFDLFLQADSSITREYGGTGLGLSICQQICKQMGGAIKVESQINVRSSFICTLPLKVAKQGADHAPVDKTVRDMNARPLSEEGSEVESIRVASEGDADFLIRKDRLVGVKILLVDDNPFNQMIVKKMLDKYQCVISCVSNGKEAVTLCHEHDFDLILMDCHMPIMDGYTATKQIRKSNSKNTSTPIVALMANVLQVDIDLCFQLGMDDYLGKPFRPVDLFLKIDKWLEKNTS